MASPASRPLTPEQQARVDENRLVALQRQRERQQRLLHNEAAAVPSTESSASRPRSVDEPAPTPTEQSESGVESGSLLQLLAGLLTALDNGRRNAFGPLAQAANDELVLRILQPGLVDNFWMDDFGLKHLRDDGIMKHLRLLVEVMSDWDALKREVEYSRDCSALPTGIPFFRPARLCGGEPTVTQPYSGAILWLIRHGIIMTGDLSVCLYEKLPADGSIVGFSMVHASAIDDSAVQVLLEDLNDFYTVENELGDSIDAITEMLADSRRRFGPSLSIPNLLREQALMTDFDQACARWSREYARTDILAFQRSVRESGDLSFDEANTADTLSAIRQERKAATRIKDAQRGRCPPRSMYMYSNGTSAIWEAHLPVRKRSRDEPDVRKRSRDEPDVENRQEQSRDEQE